MPIILRIRPPDGAVPGAPLDWTILADLAGTVDDLALRDILGDGQTLDPTRPPDLLVTSGGATLFSGAVVPTAARDDASGVTRIGLDIAGALRSAGLATALPDGAAVQVVLHATAAARYAATQPLLSPLLGQGDTLEDAAALAGVQEGVAVSSAPAHAQATLPSSTLAASVYARDGGQVTYRVRLAMPLGTAQGVVIEASCPGLPAQVQWDGFHPGGAGGIPQPGHAAYGPDSTTRPTLAAFAADPGNATVRWEFGDLAPAQGAAPEVLDLLLTTPLPATGPVLDATATESNSFGVVSTSRAAAAPAPAAQRIKVQTGILEATGPQSSFAVVGAGSGSPVAYSSWTGQFSGPVSSAAMDADPFSDRLLDVAAGDLVTFVIAVQNVAGSPAWNVVLRNTLPSGFVVPSGGADLHVTTGDGNALAATGDLFSTTDGLHLDAGAPLAAYDAQSGANVALVVFTLQATSAMPAPLAVLPSQASVVGLASAANGANLLATAPVSASTEMVSQGPALAIALTGTSAAATPGAQLAVGETATFHATVTLPSGRSQGVHLGALVPAGLALVSETITYATPGATGLWVGDASTTGFDLGTVQAGASVRVEMDIVARAVGDAAGPVQVTLSAADPGGGAPSSAAQGTTVSVQAPGLQLLVDGPAQVQTGQTAAYTVRLSNRAGAATAYGVQVQDVLGAGLQVVPGSVQASGPAAGATAGASGLSAGTSALAAGETLVLTLMARATASAGASLGLQATATAASLPGGDPAFTLPALQAAGIAAVVDATTAVTLSSPTARVGETVTVQVLATLPAGDNPAVHVSIRLPDGTALVPGSVRSGGAPASATSSSGTVDVALGAVTAPSGGGTVAVTLDALVGAVPVGTSLGFAAVVDTGYAPSPASLASLTLQDTPPSLAGLPPLVTTTDDAPAAPLAGLLLADPDMGQMIQAQVQLSNPADGVLTGSGGTYDAASGRYAVSGTAAAVQAALRGLSFVPTAHQLAYGATRTTGLSVQVADGAGGTAQAAVQVAVSGANTPPTIGGTVSGQSTTRTLAVRPLAGLTVADPDAGQIQTLQVQVPSGLGSLAGALGRYDPATGTYTAQGTANAVQADARALVFTPAASGDATFAVSLNDGAGGLVQNAATTLHIAPSADTAGVAQHFLQLPAATFLAYASGQQTVLVGESYNGPVDYLRTQLIYDSASPAVIAAQADNAFIKSFSGFCAIQVADGRNVVDAGPGSNFIVGGAGDDTFFLAGNPAAVTWDTVTGFHPGDMVTLFGFHPGTSTYAWADADGADGYTGRTLHADLAGDGQVTASLTFAGKTAADAANWAVTSGTVGGVDYLAVIGLR